MLALVDFLASAENTSPVLVAVPQYAIGWGTLTLINAGLAQAKNRSGLAWWLVSVFLGPIATFLIVILECPQRVADSQ